MHCDGVQVARQMEMEKTARELCRPRQGAAVVQFIFPKSPRSPKGMHLGILVDSIEVFRHIASLLM